MAQCLRCGRELSDSSTGMENGLCADCRENARVVVPVPDVAESALRRVPTVTIGLIFIQLAVFLLMVLDFVSWHEPSRQQLILWGANYGPLSLAGQPWRLLTSVFIHVGRIHLLMDALYLYFAGRMAERIYGKNTFLLLYLTCGLAGGVYALWLKPDAVTTSASAAIFGIVGSLAPVSWPTRLNRTNPELRWTWVLVWFGMSALNLARFDDEGTVSLSVVGGLLAGLALGVFLRPKLEQTERSRPLVFLAALVVLIVGSQVVRYAAAHVLRRERGISAYTAGRYDPAVRELEAAVREKPADAYAQAVLGEAYLHKYEYDKAEAPLKQALAVSPHYDYARRALAYEQAATRGIAAYESDDYVSAISELETAASARPDDAYIQYLLGSSYLQADDYDHAEESLRRALNLSPGYTAAEEGLAYIHTCTDRDEDGLKEYSDLVRRDPDNESARLGMGTALNNLERYDEAISVFQEAVRRHPDSADARYSLGFAYSDSKRYDQAIASLRQALRLQPKYPEAQRELADALRCQKKSRTVRPE